MTAPKQITVRDGTRKHTVPYRAGDTIVETLRQAGIDISTQCEQGYCGTCMVEVLKGDIEMRVNDALPEAELADGMRLACQGEPVGDEVEIELF